MMFSTSGSSNNGCNPPNPNRASTTARRTRASPAASSNRSPAPSRRCAHRSNAAVIRVSAIRRRPALANTAPARASSAAMRAAKSSAISARITPAAEATISPSPSTAAVSTITDGRGRGVPWWRGWGCARMTPSSKPFAHPVPSPVLMSNGPPGRRVFTAAPPPLEPIPRPTRRPTRRSPAPGAGCGHRPHRPPATTGSPAPAEPARSR